MAKIAGVYVERTRVHLSLAEYSEGSDPLSPAIELSAYEIFEVDEYSTDNAKTVVNEVVELLIRFQESTEKSDRIVSIGIGSYGPFVSLGPIPASSPALASGYGQLHPKSDLPFTGMDLYSVFRKGLQESVLVTVQTDANVTALGEAYLENIGIDDVLVAILLDKGIGGGVVAGRRPLGAHHPEMGMIPVQLVSEDPLANNKINNRYGTTLERLISFPEMIKRAKILHKQKKIKLPKNPSENDLFGIDHNHLWSMAADYVAQLCVSCTVILSPKNIIVSGSMIDGYDHLTRDIKVFFETYMGDRSRSGFNSRYLRDRDYIRLPSPSQIPSSSFGCLFLAFMANSGPRRIVPFSPAKAVIR